MEAAIKAGKHLGIVNCKKISLTNNCLEKKQLQVRVPEAFQNGVTILHLE
jgi:hypothetical protein